MWPRQRSLRGHCPDIYHAFARYLTYSGALPAPPPSQSLLSHTNSNDCELQNDAHCQENGEQIFLSLIFILFESFCKTWLIPLKLPVKIKTYNSCYRASQSYASVEGSIFVVWQPRLFFHGVLCSLKGHVEWVITRSGLIFLLVNNTVQHQSCVRVSAKT